MSDNTVCARNGDYSERKINTFFVHFTYAARRNYAATPWTSTRWQR